MPRGGGGGGGAAQYVQLALNTLVYLSIGAAVIFILAGTLGQVILQMPVTSSNPLYNVTKTWTQITTTASNLIVPLVTIGIAVFIILAIAFILKVFGR